MPMPFLNRLKGQEKIFQLTQEINEYRESPIENNYKLIQKEVNKDLGNYVEDWTIKGILTCAIIDEDDFYYLIMDKDRKMHFSSCVGKYNLIEDQDSLSNDFSVLEWLRKNDEKSLIKIVKDCIKRNEVLPISEIGVNPIKKK